MEFEQPLTAKKKRFVFFCKTTIMAAAGPGEGAVYVMPARPPALFAPGAGFHVFARETDEN
jgi:hypothetical protein